jgi:hypothetical protein
MAHVQGNGDQSKNNRSNSTNCKQCPHNCPSASGQLYRMYLDGCQSRKTGRAERGMHRTPLPKKSPGAGRQLDQGSTTNARPCDAESLGDLGASLTAAPGHQFRPPNEPNGEASDDQCDQDDKREPDPALSACRRVRFCGCQHNVTLKLRTTSINLFEQSARRGHELPEQRQLDAGRGVYRDREREAQR